MPFSRWHRVFHVGIVQPSRALEFGIHPKVSTIYTVDVISDIDEANALRFL